MAETITHDAFIGHVHELRRRLSWTAMAFIAAGTVAYFYRKPLVNFIAKPLGQPLFYSAPSGSFEFVMQVCLAIGIVVALPVIVYNLIRFIEPAFERKRMSRKMIGLIIAMSFGLSCFGLWFAFDHVLPMSLHFFSEFAFGPIKPLISTSEYFNFVIGSAVTFAIIFQLPLLLLTFNTIDRFPPGKLRKYRRHVIVGSLAVALVLPFTYDPITQFVVALPIIMLYEVSIIAIWAVNRHAYKERNTSQITAKAKPAKVKKTRRHERTTPVSSGPRVFVPATTPATPAPRAPQFATSRPIQMG